MYVIPFVLPDNMDLTLFPDTAWSRRPATSEHQESLWRQFRNTMSQAGVTEFITWPIANKLEGENRPKFLNLKKVFWIKLADFLDIVPRHPHLTGIKFHTIAFMLKPFNFGTPIPLRPVTNGGSLSGTKNEAHNSSLTNGDGNMVNGHE